MAGSVGPWLYRVAHRLALRVKVHAERHARCAQVSANNSPADPLALASGRELCLALDLELSRLPEKLRAPLILCCLESCTRDEAAQQLGLSLSVVKHRLEDGRALLRHRLLRRGFPLSAVLVAGLWNEHVVHAAPSFKLVQALIQSAGMIVSGKAAQMSASPGAFALLEDTLKAMRYARVKALLTVVLSICLAGTGVGLALRSAKDGMDANPAVVPQDDLAARTNADLSQLQPALDLHGDALPSEATARLGTIRFRGARTIDSLTYSPDGKFILSGGGDGVHLWQAATGKEIRWLGNDLEGRTGPAALSADGKKVAVAGWGREDGLAVYELATGRLLYRFGKFSDRVVPAGFSADGKVLAVNYASNTSIDMVNADTGVLLRSLREYLPELKQLLHHQVAFSADGKFLIYPNGDGVLQVVEAATGKELRRLTTVPDGIAAMVLSPDDRRLAFTTIVSVKQAGGQTTSFANNHVHIWDIASGKKIRELIAPVSEREGFFPCGPHVLKFSPNGRLLVTAGSVHGLRLWDIETGKEAYRTPQGVWYATALAFSPDGKVIAFSDAAQCVRLWNFTGDGKMLPLDGHRGPLRYMSVSRDGQQVATAGEDGAIYLWDHTTGRQVAQLAAHKEQVNFIAYSADAKALFSTGSDHKLRFWDLSTGREIRSAHYCRHWNSALVLSPDGSTLACVEAYKTIRLFNALTGDEVRTLTGPSEWIYAIQFSADSQTIVAWSADQHLHSWSVTTGKHTERECLASTGTVKPTERDSLGRRPSKVAFSTDGRYIAFGGFDFLVLKDAATGAEVRRFVDLRPKTNQAIGTLEFSPDGKMLAWGDPGDPIIELGEVASGQVRRRFAGHRSGINCLAFANHGKQLISGSEDTTALVWDLTRPSPTRHYAPARADLDSLWADLASTDAVRAYDAVCLLAAAPGESVPYLRKQLHVAAGLDKARVSRLIADLDSDKFAVRSNAMRELQELGEIPESDYRKALAARPSLEVRQRLDELLNKLRNLPPDRLRLVRAVEALELADTPEARRFLAALAGGAPDAGLTKDAKAASERLNRTASMKH
jgi:WD40 repeat protein